jgi:NAD(P)-dependent dehydrogenase (short-subunit alcohol dehydrogenase family)
MMLAGKSALITGAGHGIGSTFAARYVHKNTNVMIGDINLASAQGAAHAIGKGIGSAHFPSPSTTALQIATVNLRLRTTTPVSHQLRFQATADCVHV